MENKEIAKELVKMAKELQAVAFIDDPEDVCKQLIDDCDRQLSKFQHIIADVGENIQIKRFDIDDLIKQIDQQIYDLSYTAKLISGSGVDFKKYLLNILQNKNAQKHWKDAKKLLKQMDDMMTDIAKKKKVLQETWQYLTKAKQDIRQRIVTLRKM